MEDFQKEYLKRYPDFRFQECICTRDYICNYPFLSGNQYRCINQINTITLYNIKENKINPLKTFSVDGEDFHYYFKLLTLSDIRERKINTLFNFL